MAQQPLDTRYGRYEPPEQERPVVVYTMYDAAGAVLYVGISVSWPNRMGNHAEGSPWWRHVRRIDMHEHPSRRSALEAEAEAIHRHQPPFNIAHTARGKCPERYAACAAAPHPAATDEVARAMLALGITSAWSQHSAIAAYRQAGGEGGGQVLRHAHRVPPWLERWVAAQQVAADGGAARTT